MKNKLTKQDGLFILALWVIVLLIIILMNSCTTAKKCAAKFPCVETTKIDTIIQKVVNPNKDTITALIKEVVPCPEFKPILGDTSAKQFNTKVKEINAKNKAKTKDIERLCTDSIKYVYITITKRVFDQAKQHQLNTYIEKDKSALWHLKRLFILKWQLLLLAFSLIFIYLKYIRK